MTYLITKVAGYLLLVKIKKPTTSNNQLNLVKNEGAERTI